MRLPTPTRRTLALAAATGTAAVLAAVATVSPAQAAYYRTDNFDTASAWSKTVVGAGSANVISSGVAGNQPGQGGVGEITSKGTGFSSLGQRFTTRYSDLYCDANISLRTTNRPATVNVEVIKPSNWTYISLKTVKMAAYSSWQTQAFDLPRGPIDVVFRVSVLGDGASDYRTVNVDNLAISCGDIG